MCQGSRHPQCRKLGNPKEDLPTRKIDAAAKGKFLDPMVGPPPPYVAFMAFVSEEGISLRTR